MTNHLFVYGSLRRSGAAFTRLLAGAAVDVRSAVLEDHALFGKGLPYPFVRRHPGSGVVGDLVAIDPVRMADVLAAVDEYEGSDYPASRSRSTPDPRWWRPSSTSPVRRFDSTNATGSTRGIG